MGSVYRSALIFEYHNELARPQLEDDPGVRLLLRLKRARKPFAAELLDRETEAACLQRRQSLHQRHPLDGHTGANDGVHSADPRLEKMFPIGSLLNGHNY